MLILVGNASKANWTKHFRIFNQWWKVKGFDADFKCSLWIYYFGFTSRKHLFCCLELENLNYESMLGWLFGGSPVEKTWRSPGVSVTACQQRKHVNKQINPSVNINNLITNCWMPKCLWGKCLNFESVEIICGFSLKPATSENLGQQRKQLHWQCCTEVHWYFRRLY